MSVILARSLVFYASAAVLVIEILAARILAPYLGVSLEVFTGIIGVILAGISVGAWVGGRAADRLSPTALIGPILIAAGLTAMVSPAMIDLVGPNLTTDAVSIVLASTIGFFVPAALLSSVPPVVVKIQLTSISETGTVVGSYSAVGTAGAIFGTFVTGFVLIATFPTRPIVTVLGITLTVTGAVMLATRRGWMLLAVSGVMGILLVGNSGPCEYETKYHCAIVEVDESRPTGRLLILDRLRNSYVDLADPTYLEFRYTRLMADVIAVEMPSGPLSVVSIGGGGFTLPGYLLAERPGTANTVLEIDPQVVGIGRDELGLSPEIDVRVGDARTGIRDIADDSADLVIGDAYSGASVPWHLTTVEYNRAIDRVLRPEGVYTMNVIDWDDLRFARAEAVTLAEVFSYVTLFAPEAYLSGEAGGNFIFAASQSPIDVEGIENAIRSRGGAEKGIEGTELAAFIGQPMLLVDDFAPVDQILGRP